ncbi:hypothetical protein FHG87_015765 [Trinorchestia longiramus]|nr:hypothetical protein FHG87_015765 [Trinorchestia longiramus]
MSLVGLEGFVTPAEGSSLAGPKKDDTVNVRSSSKAITVENTVTITVGKWVHVGLMQQGCRAIKNQPSQRHEDKHTARYYGTHSNPHDTATVTLTTQPTVTLTTQPTVTLTTQPPVTLTTQPGVTLTTQPVTLTTQPVTLTTQPRMVVRDRCSSTLSVRVLSYETYQSRQIT